MAELVFFWIPIHFLFRNSRLANDFNVGVIVLRHVDVEAKVGFATSLVQRYV